MPSTTHYSFDDIVLVPFPFTDQSATKKRPAVVISSSAYQDTRPDLIIMAVTSQVRSTSTIGEMHIRGWKGAGLIKPSVVKPVITTIEASLVLRRLGRLELQEQQTLRTAISTIVG
jgi:mRNA interferase MazF